MVKVSEKTDDATINVALDTIRINKQSIVFVNTKRSAEKTAEDISKKLKPVAECLALSEQAVKSLAKPTKQCERLALCLKKGIAFHHAGLTSKQKELIEDNFRDGKVKVICATPTLCLSKETMVWHGMSETEIYKLKSSNPLFVLSKNKLISMKPQKVERIMNSSKLIEISSVSDYSIKATPNHKMLVKRKGKKFLVKAKYVEKGDRIATVGRLNINRIYVPKVKDFILDNKVNILNYHFGTKLSYFIGVMLGDGYSGAATVNGEIEYKGSPSIVGIDNEVFLAVNDVMQKFGLNCRKGVMFSGTPQLVLGKNKWFREFLLRCGVEQRERKQIPQKLTKMDISSTASLLRGLFDTDGWIEKRIGIGFSNTSERLVKQMQKLLLRFGIVSRIRKRKRGSMQIYEKSYSTLPQWELTIHNKKCIFEFYKSIGFSIFRKQKALKVLLNKLILNINYIECEHCNYKIYKDLFSGRSKEQKKWGLIKLQVIKLLGKKGELGSRELKSFLNHEPKKKDTRLNHHYELIKKRKIGSRSLTEWYWSLNKIGDWIYNNIIEKELDFNDFFSNKECPLCGKRYKLHVKKGWRDSDFDGDIYWDIVRSVKTVEVEPEVYDVVLPNRSNNDHMFVANGFIVHNSMGLDLPAFRTVLKSMKRYGRHGLQYIPVLEYMQMAGRAGRPKYDKYGEAILIAGTDAEKEELHEKYICGEPENIYSKLAVEPVLRTYILSLISTKFVNSKKELVDFFSKTFWAHQFEDMYKISMIIDKILGLLVEWEFLIGGADDFQSADELGDEKYKATKIGKRVAELYIDPLTAYNLICGVRKAYSKSFGDVSLLHLVSNTLEMRPLLRVKTSEYDLIGEKLINYSDSLLVEEPSLYEPEYEDFVNAFKTSLFFYDWINEKDEEELMEKYAIRPGEVRVKIELADWLLYCTEEMVRMMSFQSLLKDIVKLRIRVKNGVKEELITLLRLRGIGRVRARKLYNSGIRDVAGLKKADVMKLVQLLGKKTALDVKEQVGQDMSNVKVKENKRKGQISLNDYA